MSPETTGAAGEPDDSTTRQNTLPATAGPGTGSSRTKARAGGSIVTKDCTLATWVALLARRKPTPGGGSAAAVCAALGCGLAAMAARFTTGSRWKDREAEAQALAETLDRSAKRCLALADEDIKAFQAVTGIWEHMQSATEAERHGALSLARLVPEELLALCADLGRQLLAFLPRCNPHLRPDALGAFFLLAGAARTAWQLLVANRPDSVVRAAGAERIAFLRAAERAFDQELER